MTRSNSSKGNYYKIKTRDYFRGLNYSAEIIERMQTIPKGNGRVCFLKKDTFGADVLACNDTEAILANSVLGKSNIAKHIKEFKKYPSGGLKRVVVIWEKGWRSPLIREVDSGVRPIKPARLKKE